MEKWKRGEKERKKGSLTYLLEQHDPINLTYSLAIHPIDSSEVTKSCAMGNKSPQSAHPIHLTPVNSPGQATHPAGPSPPANVIRSLALWPPAFAFLGKQPIGAAESLVLDQGCRGVKHSEVQPS